MPKDLVADLMSQDMPVLHRQRLKEELQKKLSEKAFGPYPVIDEGNQWVGLLMVDRHFLNKAYKTDDLIQRIHREIKPLSPKTPIKAIQPSAFISSFLPVVEAGKFLGVLTLADYINALIQNIQDQYNELDTMLNHAYDGIAIANKEGMTIKVNEAWTHLTGLKKEEVIGIPLGTLVKRGVFKESVTMQVIQTKQPQTILQKMRSGKRAMMTGSPIFNDEGEVEKVIINIRDITKLHDLQQKLENSEKMTESYQAEIEQMRLERYKRDHLIAESKAMQHVLHLAEQVSKVDTTVLLTGESGVGKGMIAQYIHHCSEQYHGKKEPFITVNCGAIPEPLLESELFGYVGGAFTGADPKGKRGLFELAHGGTIFLDEIGDLPLSLQVKLLHVLQDKTIYKIGSTTPIKLNFRLLAATNQNLQQLVKEGKFREDLFYRLHIIPIDIPPLRKRREDIFPLAIHYVYRYNAKYGLNQTLSNGLIDRLLAYDWPGNVRELSNVIERAMVTTQGEVVPEEAFSSPSMSTVHQETIIKEPLPTLKEATQQLERRLITRALALSDTQQEAANQLGISLSTLSRRLRSLNIL